MSYDIKEAVTALHVDNAAGAIEVVPGGDVVKVSEKYEYNGARPRTQHSVKGEGLWLENTGCGSDSIQCSVSYRIQVPPSMATQLTIGGGDIKVAGLSGSTHAKAGGGSIEITDSSAKSVTAHVGGGDITASFAGKPDKVDASASGGTATVRLPQGTYDVNATTKGGQRTVRVPTDSASPHKVEAHTRGGSVTVEPVR
ncbi:DUF4097 family beta strand repeat-containing protein [Streptomyces sp. NPDC047023]|uniref:DUF4097 family beta strand repeat-containing protein n=1 Tax=Streptomyces sp. NPDC047023 TaxID=3155139 RepID=UPI0033FC3F2E